MQKFLHWWIHIIFSQDLLLVGWFLCGAIHYSSVFVLNAFHGWVCKDFLVLPNSLSDRFKSFKIHLIALRVCVCQSMYKLSLIFLTPQKNRCLFFNLANVSVLHLFPLQTKIAKNFTLVRLMSVKKNSKAEVGLEFHGDDLNWCGTEMFWWDNIFKVKQPKTTNKH